MSACIVLALAPALCVADVAVKKKSFNDESLPPSGDWRNAFLFTVKGDYPEGLERDIQNWFDNLNYSSKDQFRVKVTEGNKSGRYWVEAIPESSTAS